MEHTHVPRNQFLRTDEHDVWKNVFSKYFLHRMVIQKRVLCTNLNWCIKRKTFCVTIMRADRAHCTETYVVGILTSNESFPGKPSHKIPFRAMRKRTLTIDMYYRVIESNNAVRIGKCFVVIFLKIWVVSF